jgi:hypothetical protein
MKKIQAVWEKFPIISDWVFRRHSSKIVWLVLIAVFGINISQLFKIANKSYAGNPSGFMCIGLLGNCPEIYNDQMWVRPDSGYDSQYFYFLALNPFRSKPYVYTHQVILDHYRFQRYLYGAMAGIISFCQPKLIPYVMIGINLFSTLVGVWIFFLLCDHFKVSRLFCLFYSLSVLSWLTIMRTTCEPLYLALLISGFYFYIVHADFLKAGIFLSLAVWTKELALASVLGLLLFELSASRRYKKAIYLLLPFLAYALMQGVVYRRTGMFSLDVYVPRTSDFGLLSPLTNLFGRFVMDWNLRNREAIVILGNILLAALLLLLNLFQNRRFSHPFFLLSILYIGLLYTASSGMIQTLDVWGYGRHSAEIIVGCMFIYLYQKQKIFLLPLAVNTVGWILLVSKPYF